jgi:hypothetical protein
MSYDVRMHGAAFLNFYNVRKGDLSREVPTIWLVTFDVWKCALINLLIKFNDP